MSRVAQAASNRRVFTRTSYEGILQLQCSGGTWFDVYGQDVSQGGFAFYSDYEMTRGEALYVSIPELPALPVPATVRHVKKLDTGFLVGVEFDEPLPLELALRLTG